MHICQREFDTSEEAVSNFEVVESDVSDSLSNSSVSSILPGGQVPELCSDCRVLPERISCIVRVIDNWFTWELSGLHVMENSETISAT